MTLPVDPISHSGEHEVLGVHWDMPNDQLVFDLRSLAEKATGLQPTKRNVEHTIATPKALLPWSTHKFNQ